jgi:hypothetical protein
LGYTRSQIWVILDPKEEEEVRFGLYPIQKKKKKKKRRKSRSGSRRRRRRRRREAKRRRRRFYSLWVIPDLAKKKKKAKKMVIDNKRMVHRYVYITDMLLPLYELIPMVKKIYFYVWHQIQWLLITNASCKDGSPLQL